MPTKQISSPMSSKASEYKKLSEDIRQNVERIYRECSRDAYIERLRRCGVLSI